jgi:quercetin dioxygenase-like cupin family protein
MLIHGHWLKQFADLRPAGLECGGLNGNGRRNAYRRRIHAGQPTHANRCRPRNNGWNGGTAQGPGQFFTGAVRVDPLFPVNAPSRVSGALVTFEPGARSAWHTHPVGQLLIVTAGRGLVQQWGGPAEEIRPGDVVRIPPSVKHWHGASPSTGMSHIAIQEALGGRNVDWLEQVSDGQYAQVKETR